MFALHGRGHWECVRTLRGSVLELCVGSSSAQSNRCCSMAAVNPERVRKLREAAHTAFHKNKFAEALTRLSELETLQPSEPEWPRRAAECHRALGATSAQIDALGRAAELYAIGGHVVKAIAVCKVILGLDPKHTRTQAQLSELQGAWLGTARTSALTTN